MTSQTPERLFFEEPDEGRKELIRRAKALVDRAGKGLGYEVDSTQVGRFLIEHVRGSGVWIYKRLLRMNRAVYAESYAGRLINPGNDELVAEALNAFRAEMVLDDLAGA